VLLHQAKMMVVAAIACCLLALVFALCRMYLVSWLSQLPGAQRQFR
jgi:hypothetical protein